MTKDDNDIFAERYRPQTVDEIVGQDHIIPFLKGFVKNKKIPHLLFAGPAGCGKTTASIALAKDIFGPGWKDYFVEINASDDRGIKVVRDKIKGYARIKVIEHPFKVIFLDEVDAMTPDAQDALRRIMEKNSGHCRFILSCNYPNRLIEPIKDRCSAFRFRNISADDILKLITKVAEKEEINITESAMIVLSKLSKGSMRKALTTLHTLKLSNISEITKETIYDIMCFINDEHVIDVMKAIKDKDIKKVDDLVDRLLSYYCYEPAEIIESLYDMIKLSKVLDDESKVDALLKLADIEFRLAEKASPQIQLKCFAMYLVGLYAKETNIIK